MLRFDSGATVPSAVPDRHTPSHVTERPPATCLEDER